MRQPFIPDLLIEDIQGKPIAAVAVQSRINMDVDAATEIHRNLLDSGLPANIPYFLLLSQEVGYLWKGAPQLDPGTLPSYKFPMRRVIAQYSLREPDQRLFQSELSLLMLHWLTNLSSKPQNASEEPEKTLAQAGFNESIRDAMVLIEEAL